MKEEKQKNIWLRKGAYSGRYGEEKQLGTTEIELQQILKKALKETVAKKFRENPVNVKPPNLIISKI